MKFLILLNRFLLKKNSNISFLISLFNSITNKRFKIFSVILSLITLLLLTNSVYSQSNIFLPKDSSTVNKNKLKALIITESAVYLGSMTTLYYAWYSNYPMNQFHFFNDDKEWLQMDKFGHITTSYYVGKVGYEALKWSGVKEKNAIWYGGTLGWTYLMIVETMDGFSKEWGFSPGDFSANTLGSALFIGQQLAWKEQRITLKFSAHTTSYAQYHPNELGSNLQERILKDYNGQTYWLSANIYSFLPKSSGFPKWLNVAIGYGAEGMTGAKSNNPVQVDGKSIIFDRYRQIYLSLDIDLTKIHPKSKTLEMLFNVIGFIKFPMPTLEYNTPNGFKFHGIYF